MCSYANIQTWLQKIISQSIMKLPLTTVTNGLQKNWNKMQNRKLLDSKYVKNVLTL